jgi:DNA-binding transcriptional ArsR family regulator
MRIYAPKLDEVFKALGDETRIRIVRLLAKRSLCVCQIVDALGEPQYKVSRHLGILKRAGILVDRREGTWMHYSLHPECHPVAVRAIRDLASQCTDGVFAQDDTRLAKSRPRACRTSIAAPAAAGAREGGGR